MQVNTIEQRIRNPLAVVLNLTWRASALSFGISKIKAKIKGVGFILGGTNLNLEKAIGPELAHRSLCAGTVETTQAGMNLHTIRLLTF